MSTPHLATNGALGLRVGIVGAGPAGLTCAIGLAESGARVRVFDLRPDPRYVTADDERSFSLTLAGLALSASGSVESAIRETGQLVVGRAIYVGARRILTPYGLRPTDCFVAINRSRLQEIQIRRAESLGVTIDFGCEVVNADASASSVEWRTSRDIQLRSDRFDLLVFADGVNGVGRRLLEKRPGCSALKLCDGTEYVRARITSEQAAHAHLPPDRILFWPGPGGPTVAIPEREGAVDALVMGTLPGDFEDPPFTQEADATSFLARRNQHLLDAVPGIAAQLVGVRRGHFVHAMSSDWRVGPRAVAIGDAVRCAPPYSGAGGGAAMDDAAELTRAVVRNPDLSTALREFEVGRRVASKILHRMIAAHGRFLKARLGSRMWYAAAKIELALEQSFGYRTLYQRIVFERGGLSELVRTESDSSVGGSRPELEAWQLAAF